MPFNSSMPSDLAAATERMRRLARALVGNAHDAEDVAQEAWCQVLRSSSAAEDADAWLNGVARNVARHHGRAGKRRKHREAASAKPESQSPDQLALDHIEAVHALVKVVRSLPQPYRSALVFQYVVGMAPAEAAAALGVNRATLRSRVHRGLAMVRAELERRSSDDRNSWRLTITPLLASGGKTMLGGLLMSKATSLAGVALLVLFCAGGAALWVHSADPGEEVEGAAQSGKVAAQPGVPPPPSLEGQPPSRKDSPESGRGPAEDELGAGTATPIRIEGHVRVADPAAHKWHTPIVSAAWGSGSTAGRSTAEARGGGKYSIEIHAASAEAQQLEVVARAPGALPAFRRLLVQPGSTVALDFDLQAGSSISGQIRSRDGHAVSDIELFISSDPVMGMSARNDRIFDTMNGKRLLAGETARYFEARCMTDASGRFRATGLAAGQYTAWTTSDDWFIRQTRRIEAGASGIELIADPAAGLELVVKDSSTGKPVSSFRGTARIAAGQQRVTMPLTGQAGRAEFVWAEYEEESTTGFTVDVTVRAEGYSAATVRAEATVGKRYVTLRMDLVPRATGLATVVAVDPTGTPVPFDLVADMTSQADESDRLRRVPLDRGTAPGHYLLKGPSGAWAVRLKPKHELGHFLALDVEINLSASSTVETRAVFPEYGSLALRRESAGNEPAAITVTVQPESGGATAMLLFTGISRTFSGIPVGRWKIGVAGSEQTVEVRRGETAVVTMERD
jgi:RNA polymerase sigma factor (sigma-70 family)